MSRADLHHNQLALAAGIFGNLNGQAQTRAELKTTVGLVRYYSDKVFDPTLHSGTWGGARNLKFDDQTRRRIERYLWRKLLRDPRRTATELARRLQAKGLQVEDQ